MDSILDTVKLALGVEADYNGFDTNILLDINGAIFSLNQLGVSSAGGFVVKGEGETWEDLLGDTAQFELVKSYILAKVRLSFDPPPNSFLVDAIQKQIAEYEWRLMVQGESPTHVSERIVFSRIQSTKLEEEIPN
jgi:hypothetical protein